MLFIVGAEYEVDFITYFTKVANLGAKFDSNKYLYPITLELPRITEVPGLDGYVTLFWCL